MYEYYSTLEDLKQMVDEAIAKYGKDKKFRLVGCYGSEGTVEEFRESTDEPALLNLITDLCSG